MTLNEILQQLKALGIEGTRAHNAKWGAGANQFGVKHGDLWALAKKVQPDHALAMSLWKTGNVDAQLLAVLLIKPKELSAKEVDRLVTPSRYRTTPELHSCSPRCNRRMALVVGQSSFG